MVGNYSIGKNGLYILRKQDIENEAEIILNKYCPNCLSRPQKIDIEKLIEEMGLKLLYAKMSEDSEILGAFVFNKGVIPTYSDNDVKNIIYDEKTIIIDSTIADNDDPRLMFTYGHELGHYVTQYNVYHIDKSQLSLFDYSDNTIEAVVCKRDIVNIENTNSPHKKLITREDWQEWQANYFSSSILIPKCTLKIALKPYLDNYDIMDQRNLLDKFSDEKLKELIDNLSNLFEVSSEMMKNRLKGLGYLS